jgi:hypothetical protein
MDTGAPIDPIGSTGSSNIAGTWTTALIAASGIVLGWVIQTALLAEVSLFRGFAPRLGRNLQIAIWSSVPLGLMAALQLLYYAAGGTTGAAGVSGLLSDWEGYGQLSPFAQAVLLSLTSRLTFFWVWSLVLIYIGARQALSGRWWSSLLVVIAWMVVVVVVPVITGAIEAPGASDQAEIDDFSLDFLSGDGLPGIVETDSVNLNFGAEATSDAFISEEASSLSGEGSDSTEMPMFEPEAPSTTVPGG